MAIVDLWDSSSISFIVFGLLKSTIHASPNGSFIGSIGPIWEAPSSTGCCGKPVEGNLIIFSMLSLPFQIGFDILLYHINNIYMKRKNIRAHMGPRIYANFQW